MDFIIAIMYAQRPIFPMFPCNLFRADCSIADDQEEFHRQWIVLFADRAQGDTSSEWALAWFALDNMMHRTCHTASDAITLRQASPRPENVEAKIQASIEPLLEAHRKWRDRKVVKDADGLEEAGILLAAVPDTIPQRSSPTFPFDMSTILPTAQSPVLDTDDDTPSHFLHYPPVHLTNFFFANLLNHYRSIEIYITLILRPVWGTVDPRRFQCAVDLCRTHAALGKERNFLTTGKIWGLHLAGIAFGGEDLYPVEPIHIKYLTNCRGNRNG
jgi:hypothetical protein